MITGMDISNLKKTLAKNPKSLLFAQYAEVLRLASLGDKQKLDEALLVANKGMESNPDFLPGKLARGRILLEKGDLVGARIDFEAVAKRDQFCLSALKLLLETAEKQGQPLQTEIYANILNTFEPKTEVKAGAKKNESDKAPDLVPFTRTQKAKPSAAEPAALSAALDNLLEEDEKEEGKTENLVFKAVDNILDSTTPQSKPLPLPEATSILEKEPVAAASKPQTPNIDNIVKEQLADKPVGNLPDLTGDINSLLATSAPSVPTASEPPTPDVDSIVKEQLADKPVGKLPDLTGDINSLLALESTSYSSPPIDDIVKEQLADRVDNIPDLTGDINSLLTAKSEPESEPELRPYVPKKASPSQIDDEILTQNPTLTLAELYMDQGLPQKAAAVYKELLAQEPGNEELKKKLALAESKA
jgi:hypothetical protein